MLGIREVVSFERPEINTASIKFLFLFFSPEKRLILLFPSIISYDCEGETEVEGEDD